MLTCSGLLLWVVVNLFWIVVVCCEMYLSGGCELLWLFLGCFVLFWVGLGCSELFWVVVGGWVGFQRSRGHLGGESRPLF